MFDIALLDDPSFIRPLQVQIMRAGFGIHPERPILLFLIESQLPEIVQSVISDVAARYFEIDFVIHSPQEVLTDFEEDNIYTLSACNEKQLFFLIHKSLWVLADTDQSHFSKEEIFNIEEELPPRKLLTATIITVLEKAGYSREGMTAMAMVDNNTTERINFEELQNIMKS